MATLYFHPDGHYIGGVCAPRDMWTRSELGRDPITGIAKVSTRKGVMVCRHCGRQMIQTTGAFHVVPWSGMGHYRDDDVVSTHATRAAAEKARERMGDDYVVRTW